MATKASLFILLILLQVQSTYAQCNGQVVPEPSFFCDSAPILCQIECLDNFQGTLPDTFMAPQPESLCNGGEANNMSWFAFVAGSDSISLTIVPSNCTEVVVDSAGSINRYEGIQVGIYKNCDFEDSDRELICATPCSDGPVEIGSSQFEIGQIYYLFVDGCAGSVCDYAVNVNFGEQAFEMPEFTAFSNSCNLDFESDTICAGTVTDVTLTGFNLDVQYNWTIEPGTSTYPTGEHPVTDTSTVTWQFDEPGSFQICVFANNFCDANDTLCFDVVVDTLVDEYFTDIFVCQECFPIILGSADTTCVIGEEGVNFPSILTENPNSDAIAGWLGFDLVMTPGIVEHVVPTTCGCSYKQIVNVQSIPIKPRASVKLYRCADDFPFDYHGQMITGPVENLFVSIENAASTRCDSLVDLTVEFFGQTSDIVEGDCEDGGVMLLFDLNADIPPGAVVSYEWMDGTTIISDSDGIDSTMLVTSSGFYSIAGTFTLGGETCQFTKSSGFIDLDNLTPDSPTFGMIGQDFCQDDRVLLYVEDEGQSVSYEWSLIPSLPYVFGMTSDTIYVDASTSFGFQYSAVAVNDCGQSMEIVDNVTVSEMPTVAINMPDEVCVDSLINVLYDGTADLATATFTWDFGGANVISTADVNGPGPHTISWDLAGTFDVTCVVTDGPCSTAPQSSEIVVMSSQSLPLVSCNATSVGVSYTIESLPADVSYSYTVLSGTFTTEEVVNDVITFGGMEANTSIVIEISFVTNCGEITESYECMVLDCPMLDLSIISMSDLQICNDGTVESLTLSPTLAGAATDMGSWTSDNISTDGEVDAVAIGIGSHTFVYEIEQGSCIYQDSVLVEVYDVPEVEAMPIIDPCDPAILGSVQLTASIPDGTFTLDGTTSDDGLFTELQAGEYLAVYQTAQGCTIETTVSIEIATEQNIQIQGNLNVPADSEQRYELLSSISEVVSILWIVNEDTLCQGLDCNDISFMPQDGDAVTVVVVYGENCDVSDQITIATYRPTTIFFPTIFSPNGDNNNDTFYPITNNPNLDIEQISIFDRWGNCVHSEANTTMGEDSAYWDGTMNGTALANGVYLYVVIYKDDNGDSQSITGDVTIAR